MRFEVSRANGCQTPDRSGRILQLLGSVKFDVAPNYEQMSRRAEKLIAAELENRPDLILCASAGGTPTRLYELLAGRRRRQPELFEQVRILQIDEWGGVPAGHPASCQTDLRVKLLEPLGIGRERYTGFRSDAPDPEAECRRMRRWLAKNGPIDICILGLGANGHLAMNEPAPELTPHAHVARLAPSSLNHGMLRDLKRKPRYGLTLGMRDILCSRLALLVVNGAHKSAPMRRLREGTVTTAFPASFLWLHPRAVLLCDRAAAGHSNPHSVSKLTRNPNPAQPHGGMSIALRCPS